MSPRSPSSVASRHLLPRGEKEELDVIFPSPLEGEGGSRRLTDEGAAGRTLTFAKQLRKGMTEAEGKLWSTLRDRRFEKFKFRRQVPIGKYIADFICQECKLIVEVDGQQHEGSEHDKVRDAYLTSVGYRVLRFWNPDIYVALDGTLLAILDALNDTPHPALRATFSRQGEKGKEIGMTREHIYLFDTTLRDGQQTPGVDFSVDDKLVVIDMLDSLGLDYIEGGYPGANPTDTALFNEERKMKAKFTAFGMVKRAGRSVSNDSGLQDLLNAKSAAICFVAKSWDYHVRVALGCTNEENLESIRQSVEAAKFADKEVLVDCEHFFDGYKANPDYAVACAKAAYESGARWVVLCDTNGGTMPSEISTIVHAVAKSVPGNHLGIHAHNDTDQAVANSLAAIDAGVRHVQGTLNGIGERCGNANLVSIIATLGLKKSYLDRFAISVDAERLQNLTHVARAFDELLNRAPNAQAPYVGKSAFATKAGIHASAIVKEPETYEHIPPETVGNRRRMLVSDQAGKSNLVAELHRVGMDVKKDDKRLDELLREVKEREAVGYAYDGADASFELLARRTLGHVPEYFNVLSFRVIVEQRDREMISEAVVKVKVAGETFINAGEGNGPVNALDVALRKDLGKFQPYIEDLELVDYKVRILNGGTTATTRVLIESRDGKGNRWFTVGVSPNIVDASFQALSDSIIYKLMHEGVTAE